MASVYAARLRNAHRIGKKLKKLLSEGYMIMTDEGDRITQVNYKGFRGSVGLRINNCIVYMDADTTFDNGIHTTIKNFNAQFKNWKAYKPSDAISLI